MNKIEIKDAYFNEDNSMLIIEAKCKDKTEDAKFVIDDNFRTVLEYLDSGHVAINLFETMATMLDVNKKDIEYSKEDFEKIRNLIEIA